MNPGISPDVTDAECRDALAAFDRCATHAAFHTGRYRMRFATWGSGPPLVIVHGLSDAVRGFAMVMHRLSAHFTCIAYELPNGLDDGAKLGSYHHRHYADDLFALLDHLKLDRVALLGSSFGTTVALRALAEAPQRFTKCVLKGGFARRPLKWYERLGARQGRYWSGRLCELPLREFALRQADPATWANCSPLSRELFLRCNGDTPIAAACRRDRARRARPAPAAADDPHAGAADRRRPRPHRAARVRGGTRTRSRGRAPHRVRGVWALPAVHAPRRDRGRGRRVPPRMTADSRPPLENAPGAAIIPGEQFPAGVAEWQTHQLEGLAGAILCRFKSCLPHLVFPQFLTRLTFSEVTDCCRPLEWGRPQ